MDIGERVAAAVRAHPAVASMRLTGSRAAGAAHERSDWDFLVEASDFGAVAEALPSLLAPLEPVAAQWDRLSDTACYMPLFAGPVKVDLIFPDVPHEHEPPWRPSAETLPGIDLHFWDWTLWIASKEAAGKTEQVGRELAKLHDHLLGRLGAPRQAVSVADAIVLYREARTRAERSYGTTVPQSVEEAVLPALS